MQPSEPFHVRTLLDEQRRRGTAKKYPLRAFAKDLGVSTAALSRLLGGKKGLSEKLARSVGKKLALQPFDLDLFVLSILSQHGHSLTRRREAQIKIRSLESLRNRTRELAPADYEHVQKWHYPVLFELLSLSPNGATPEDFAPRLGMKIAEVSQSLERLVQLGLLIKENDLYFPNPQEVVTPMDVPSSAVRAFHADMMSRARIALERDAVTEREFINMTLAFADQDMAEVKDFLRDVRQQFWRRFSENRAHAEKNRVYQLSMQFFRVDAPGKELP